MRIEIPACLALLISYGSVTAFAQQQEPCDVDDKMFDTTGSMPDTATAVRRHEMLMSHLPKRARVVVIGDSLVQAWPQPLLDRLSPGEVVLNLGVGRDRIQNVIFRVHDPRLSAAHLDPRYTVILVGTNNLGLSEKSCALKESIDFLVEEVRGLWKDTKIVILGILPRGESLAGYLSVRLTANHEMMELTRKYRGVYYLDLDDAFNQKRAVLDQLFLPDMLHLRGAGYELITAAVARLTSGG